jgi:hypothetical protein
MHLEGHQVFEAFKAFFSVQNRFRAAALAHRDIVVQIRGREIFLYLRVARSAEPVLLAPASMPIQCMCSVIVCIVPGNFTSN